MSENPQDIELYKVLYNAYADEIKNLWQRSVFLGAFMVLVWSGYGALQLKAIEIIENLAQSAQNCVQNAEQTLNLVYITLYWTLRGNYRAILAMDSYGKRLKVCPRSPRGAYQKL